MSDIPRFSVMDRGYGGIEVIWHEDVCELLKYETCFFLEDRFLMEVMGPGKTTEIETIFYWWLQALAKKGDLYFDTIRQIWRYGL